jgi:hypothetical protein
LGLSVAATPSVTRAQQPAPGAPAPAAPPSGDRAQEAKQRYETGMAHFQLEEWDAAIEEWQNGFRAKPVPQFLYNIAQAYRLSKRYDKALSYYQKYLRMDPKAPNKAEVDRHVTQLTALIEQEKKTQVAPPVMPIAVKPKAEPGATQPKPGEPGAPTEPGTNPQPPPVAVTPQPPAQAPPIVEVKKEPEKPTPITKKKWFWPVVGAGAAVVVAVVVIGVVVGTSSSDNTRVLPLARF